MFYRIFFILLILTTILNAQAIYLDKNMTKIDDFTIEYYQDEERSLGIDNVTKVNFDKNLSNSFSLGYAKGNSWFKFTVSNSSQSNKENFILYLSEHHYEETNFYSYERNRWTRQSIDFNLPVNKREFKDKNPSFSFILKAGESKTFYLQTYTKIVSFLKITIYEKGSYSQLEHNIGIVYYTFYLGTLFLLLLISIFLYYRIKEPIYGYYNGYAFFHLIFIFSTSGLYIYTPLQKYYYLMLVSASILMIFLILFSISYLKIKLILPKVYKILKIFVWIYALISLFMAFDIETFYPLLTYVSSIAFSLLIFVAIYSIMQGSKEAKYYLIAITFYLSTMTLINFMVNGWLPYNDITRYAFNFGSFIEMLFFTLMIVDRFNVIQKKRIKLQKELIRVKSINEQELEAQVQKRSIKLKSLLCEKELLLKEIQHRVKNNFQMVLNILWFESNKQKNLVNKTIFNELEHRIQAMSELHSMLYSAQSIENIKSDYYFENIVQNIKRIHAQYSLKIDTDLETYSFNLDEAYTLGSILNEILTNAIKHHPNKNSCEINIKFYSFNKRVYLSVKDNGLGIPTDKTSEGLGLVLIESFCKKLSNSKYDFEDSNGTTFILEFSKTE